MFHTRWQRRRRTGNQAINWTSRMAYNLTSLFYNAHLQTSILRIQVWARTNHVTVHFDCRHCVDLGALCRCFRQRRQTSKMSMSDQRKMLRCRVDRLIRCHTRSMHSNRHGRKQSLWCIKIVWLKTYNVKPFWCVTSWVHADIAIHRKDASDTETWSEHSWKEMRASPVCVGLSSLCTMFHTTLGRDSEVMKCFTQGWQKRRTYRKQSINWTMWHGL